MRETARAHKKIGGNGMLGSNRTTGNEEDLGGQVGGRGLKQTEVWEALGYGRVERKVDEVVVKKQKLVAEKLTWTFSIKRVYISCIFLILRPLYFNFQ